MVDVLALRTSYEMVVIATWTYDVAADGVAYQAQVLPDNMRPKPAIVGSEGNSQMYTALFFVYAAATLVLWLLLGRRWTSAFVSGGFVLFWATVVVLSWQKTHA